MKLPEIAGKPSWMPNSKSNILTVEPMIHDETGVNEIVLFNAVAANYFKHHYKWSADWTSTDGVVERETIENVTKLGLALGATNNLEIAMRSLELKDISELIVRLKAWREKLSENLRTRLSQPRR